MTFEKLGVKPAIVQALHEINLTEPTDIQTKTFPVVKQGKDVIGISNTGSGKTAAFGIPVLDNLDLDKGLQTLILAPTRELVVQIAGELEKWGKYLKCTVATVFGGVAIDPQIKRIRKSHIVVGTPGRLLDHLSRGTLDLSKLQCIVLDEADKMVDMGFIDDIREILKHCPKTRQVLLFGATVSPEIDRIKKQYMKDPVTAEGARQVKQELLKQYYFNLKPHQKFSFLVHLLKKEDTDRVIVFCSTRNTVEVVANNLKKQGLKVAMIHGKLSQNRRLKVIEGFNKGVPNILVASTVAARGLHIENVSHVFNYDLSQDPEEYIHRIGRTARAGTSGVAFTLLADRDHDAFREILHRYDVKVEQLELEDFEKLVFDARASGQRSGGRGRSFGGRERSFGGSRGNNSGGRPRSHSGPRRGSGRRDPFSGPRSSRGHDRRGGGRTADSFGVHARRSRG